MKTIHAIHQGFELYGSDRSFIQCVEVLRKNYPDAKVRVILPQTGPLSEELERIGFPVEIHNLWILRKSFGWGLITRLITLPRALWRAHKVFEASDLVYINTAVVADYLIAARVHRRKAIAHIREIPTGLAHRVVSALVRWSRATLFFNSQATGKAFSTATGVRRAIIYNGFGGPDRADPPCDRGDGKLRLLMLGRINDWKGQDLLVEAISLLPEAVRQGIEVKVVGDAFEGQPYRRDLEALVCKLGLSDQVSIEGFVADPSTLLHWSDVVAVPSRKPEPFWRVAIEGMAWAKPIIAAGHGGLTEIVDDEKTGLLFNPGDAADLSRKIASLIDAPARVRGLGAQARDAYERRFTERALEANLIKELRVNQRIEAKRA